MKEMNKEEVTKMFEGEREKLERFEELSRGAIEAIEKLIYELNKCNYPAGDLFRLVFSGDGYFNLCRNENDRISLYRVANDTQIRIECKSTFELNLDTMINREASNNAPESSNPQTQS